MSVFNTGNIVIAPGTLYAAPLLTVEPTSISGAWNAAWLELGFTDQGSEFDFTAATSPVTVEETIYDVKQALTGYSIKLTFALAELTAQNLALALNGGIGAGAVSGVQTVQGDGTIAVEPPAPGTETRVMLGWDALPEGATAGAGPYGRLIVRQAFQTGAIKRVARKGNNKSLYAVEFTAEKPPASNPFRWLIASTMAA